MYFLNLTTEFSHDSLGSLCGTNINNVRPLWRGKALFGLLPLVPFLLRQSFKDMAVLAFSYFNVTFCFLEIVSPECKRLRQIQCCPGGWILCSRRSLAMAFLAKKAPGSRLSGKIILAYKKEGESSIPPDWV